jgi:hypothetical protein
MFSSPTFSKKLFPLFLFFSVLFLTRFYGLTWGDGHFFHPDENNMARALSSLSFQDFNPHFFAYGAFPLYLSFFTGQVLNFILGFKLGTSLSFSTSVYLLRFYSALFSILSVWVLKLIYQKTFSKQPSFPLLWLSVFTPGLIQIAHFGTTESLLCLTFLLNIYFSQNLFSKNKLNKKILFLCILNSGLALATKITTLFFLLPIVFSFFLGFLSSHQKARLILSFFLFLLLSFSLALLLSPYNYLVKNEFLSSMKYEIAVAQGSLDVFYTRQFKNTIPYLFQFQKIYPFAIGWPMFFLSLLSLPLLFLRSIKDKNLRKNLLLIFLPSFVYFLYNAQLYTKWTRFMAPTFFIFPLFSAYFISSLFQKIKSPLRFFFLFSLLLFSVFPGLRFLKVYFSTDIRVQATSWLLENIPAQTLVLSEGGNVVNLPLSSAPFLVNNFDFYTLDEKPGASLDLSQLLSESDYLLVPSRRIFMNHSTLEFPITQRYYSHLFSGDLGFKPLKTFSILPLDENAEETWSVFDHPVIRVYQKEKTLTQFEYQHLLTSP